jgi:predicted HicB family RNase H-like nuclease
MRQKMSQWPAVFVRVRPEVFDRIEAQAEERALSVSAVIRETLDRAHKPAEAR